MTQKGKVTFRCTEWCLELHFSPVCTEKVVGSSNGDLCERYGLRDLYVQALCPFKSQTTSNHFYLTYTFFNWNISLSLINTSSLWLTANVYNHFGLIRKFLYCLHYLDWSLKYFGCFPACYFNIQKITFKTAVWTWTWFLCVLFCCSLKLFPAYSDKMWNQNIQAITM